MVWLLVSFPIALGLEAFAADRHLPGRAVTAPLQPGRHVR